MGEDANDVNYQQKICSFQDSINEVIAGIAGGVRYAVNVNALCFVKILVTDLLHF